MKALILKNLTLAMCASSALLLAACNDDDNNSSNNNNPPAQTQKETITGTAATGAALANADIEVVNKNGIKGTAKAGADGKFSVSVDAGAPYIIKATKGDTILYSYAATAGYVNVTQLTTQVILAANKNATDRDYNSLAELYTNWKKVVTELSSAEEITNALDVAAKQTIANLKSVFERNGFNATTGYPDLFKTQFTVGAPGLDKVLDSVKISGLNQACSGVGSTYSCNVTYTIDGVNYTNSWNYNISTTGINIVVTNPNGGFGGNYNLKVTTSVGGQGTSVTINNVPKPDNKDQFCAASNYNQAGLPAGFVINSCDFNGTVGNISATVNTQGISFSYTVKYEYTRA